MIVTKYKLFVDIIKEVFGDRLVENIEVDGLKFDYVVNLGDMIYPIVIIEKDTPEEYKDYPCLYPALVLDTTIHRYVTAMREAVEFEVM